MRFAEFSWQGVEPGLYKKDPEARWRAVARQTLIGGAEGTPFHLRYFEVEPGGYTTYERHAHQHVVVALRGKGEVRLGRGLGEPQLRGRGLRVAERPAPVSGGGR